VPYQDWNKHGLKKGSNWVETFGYHGYEFCEAWYLAAYIDKVAAAGKAKYDLPMYVNVWTSFSAAWGVAGVEFPCGGPGPRTFEIWLAAVEYLDIIAPDNYEQNSYRFEVQCDFFNRGENTLFIPESSKNITGACNMFYAIAHGAVGYSCFGAESCIDSEGNLNELGIPIRDTNFGVQRVIPLIVKHRNTGRMYPVVKKHDGETDRFFEFEEFIGNVTLVNPVLRNDQSRPDYINKRDMVPPELAVPRGLIIEDEDRVFYLAGRFNLRLIAKRSSEVLKILQHLPLAEFLSVEEGHFNDNGIFTTDRIRNGDEVYFCGFWVTPRCGVVRIKLL
jgi:hypothetical protein